MADDEILTEAKEAFEMASDAEQENRNLAIEDIRFARLADQWPEEIRQRRRFENRPILTINKMPAFIRQVVNDARQNKTQIKVRPIDNNADVETADIIRGLIRNIEQTSNASVAYETAADDAVTGGFGYFRIDVDYSHDDTFDQDITIERINNPLTVYGDPYSQAADSSDWNTAFIVDPMPRKIFEARYHDADEVDWDDLGYTKLTHPWFDDQHVLVAEYWKREEVDREILLLSDGNTVGADVWQEEIAFVAEALGVQVVERRAVKSHEITHYVLTGAEVLEETKWPGRFIPIIPVYGEEINIEGRRYFKSLIRDAKDAQRMFNYWRSATTELVALAPKAPFVGPEDAFTGQDARKWETANTENHAFLAYGGDVPPERTVFAGVPAGALQESLNANDDMKAIMGLFDASLGARSNETSGRAIMARQREGDVSTFHFLDNLSRSIRHGGAVILDLIPHVYTPGRIVRVLGEDGVSEPAQIGDERMQGQEGDPRKFAGVYSLSAGKYDLTVDIGPAYTTRRQEAAEQMMELVRQMPQVAPVIGDLLVQNLDWPGADEIAKRLRALQPKQEQMDPRIMQMAEQLKGMEEALREAQGKLEEAEADKQIDMLKVINDAYDSETKRIGALATAKKSIAEARSPPGPHDRYEGNYAAR